MRALPCHPPRVEPAGTCLSCDIIAGRTRPPGGILLREPPFVVYGYAGGFLTPVRGYAIVGTLRHTRALWTLDDDEAGRLGPLLRRVQRAQMKALGADHAYAFTIGDLVPHFHAHVVPRFPDSPPNLRGGRLFQATAADALPLEEVEAACRALAEALRT
jgi:diadenosine tetraphosphate (Ap4A) HIT family hydrolase